MYSLKMFSKFDIKHFTLVLRVSARRFFTPILMSNFKVQPFLTFQRTFVSFIWKLIQVIQKHWSKRIYLILYISYENWYIQDIYVIMSKTKTYFYIIPIQYNFLFSKYIHLFIFFCRHSFVPQSRGLLKTNNFDN